MRVFTVLEPAFKVEPLFVLGAQPDQARALFRRRRFRVDLGNIGERDDTCLAGQMFSFDRTPWHVVWTRHLDAGVALHETFHLVTRICHDRGIPIRAYDERGDHGDETAAYLFEFFARAVLRRIAGAR
ncbi:MAG: hypothetical protein ACRD3C_22610 [Vicinamibacterales bacterium]